MLLKKNLTTDRSNQVRARVSLAPNYIVRMECNIVLKGISVTLLINTFIRAIFYSFREISVFIASQSLICNSFINQKTMENEKINEVEELDYSVINFKEKMDKFSDHWSPKIIAKMNNYHFKLVKFQGDFVWHKHTSTDETFIILEGEMGIEFRERKINLKSGEMFVVPKNAEHRPFAKKECQILLIEPSGTINTGDIEDILTTEKEVWI